jgi:hypothetical protein
MPTCDSTVPGADGSRAAICGLLLPGRVNLDRPLQIQGTGKCKGAGRCKNQRRQEVKSMDQNCGAGRRNSKPTNVLPACVFSTRTTRQGSSSLV